MFIPTIKKELKTLGWKALDVILVTGDTYIDSPFTGAAVIGKVLIRHGYRVGIIAQPDMTSDKDIARLGEPELFWGITSGSVDSMVSNYTALKKRRKSDDYTPGGINNRRPDRAVIAYTNLVKCYFKDTVPIVIGGIEASLRRICHYDFWSNSIRRSILFDARADYLIYGMAEQTVLNLARCLKENPLLVKANKATTSKRVKATTSEKVKATISEKVKATISEKVKATISEKVKATISEKVQTTTSERIKDSKISSIRGVCYISSSPPPDYLELPAYAQVSRKENSDQFQACFQTFYRNSEPFFYRNNELLAAKGMYQQQDTRYLIHNPPALYPDTAAMDRFADIGFERDVHPYYKQSGKVKALDTIQFSISTHRGCYGECNFCAIAVHEGRTVRWRSQASILNEVRQLTKHPDFKGIISDAGGPTANMYGFECTKKLSKGACPDKRCIFPAVCKHLKPDHAPQIALLEKIRQIKGVRKVFVASGIRYDLIFADLKNGKRYLEQIVKHHVSGQMKVAPEHTEPHVLALMGKPHDLAIQGKSHVNSLIEFKKRFDALSEKMPNSQFLTYYLIAAHPGCTMGDMKKLKIFAHDKLKVNPKQVQIFTPTPSTCSTLMYYTGNCPFTGKKLFVEKEGTRKEQQKKVITESRSHERGRYPSKK